MWIFFIPFNHISDASKIIIQNDFYRLRICIRIRIRNDHEFQICAASSKSNKTIFEIAQRFEHQRWGRKREKEQKKKKNSMNNRKKKNQIRFRGVFSFLFNSFTCGINHPNEKEGGAHTKTEITVPRSPFHFIRLYPSTTNDIIFVLLYYTR